MAAPRRFPTPCAPHVRFRGRPGPPWNRQVGAGPSGPLPPSIFAANMLSRAFGLLRLIGLRLRGLWYQFRYGVLGRHQIGKRLLVGQRLVIRGPGKVILGDFVSCGDRVDLFTDRPESVIEVGDHTFLNGTRMSCGDSIRIGSGCILADCRLLDSDYHNLDPERREETPTPRPVVIGDRVWLTMGVFVLKGVTIGSGVTVSPGSVVATDLEARCLYGGNPVQLIKRLDAPK